MSVVAGKKVLLVIASNGFQELEYNIPKKILTQAGVIVKTVSNKPGGAVAKDGSTANVDFTLDQIDDITKWNGIFFIGGPGAMAALDNSQSYHLLSQARINKIPYGAICISVRILAKADALVGIKATGLNDDLALESILTGHKAIYETEPIVTDGLVVTAIGPSAAKEFGNGIIRVLTKKALEGK